MGLDSSSSGGGEPPDTQGAAGPNSYLETVNATVAISGKTSGATIAQDSLNDFFFTKGGLNNVGSLADAFSTYDSLAGRFIVGDIDTDLNGANTIVLAVSTTSNPTNLQAYSTTNPTGDWYFYEISTAETGIVLQDYPGNVGYNADALVITENSYDSYDILSNNGHYLHTLVNAISIKALTTLPSGTTLTKGTDVFQTDISNGFSLRPVTMKDAKPGDPMWFVAAGLDGQTSEGENSDIDVRKMTDVLSNSPNLSPHMDLTVNPYYNAAPPLQPDGTAITSGIDSRIMNADEANGQIVAAQTVSDAAGDEDNARWYQIDVSSGSATLVQQGDVSGGPGVYNTYPGIAINSAGAIGMSYIHSGTAPGQFMSMNVAGRFNTPDGQMQAPLVVPAGTGTANHKGGEGLLGSLPPRAGDMSGINVDPTDGSFWAANEFANTEPSPNWGTAIAHFTVPNGPIIVDSLADTQGAHSGVTLREAINYANAKPGPDVIRFDPSLFDSGPATIHVFGGLFINEPVTIEGPGMNQLTISADGHGSVFTVGSPGALVTLKDLSIANGNSVIGGGIDSLFSKLELDNVRIAECSAVSGGGIYNDGGRLTIRGSIFWRNTATDTISTVFPNVTADGGGIYNEDGGILTIGNTEFSNNHAHDDGGAIYTEVGSVHLRASSLHGNDSGGDGGAIYNHGSGVHIRASSVRGNDTAYLGGAIYNDGPLYIQDSTLANNAAATGGGIYEKNSEATIVNSTITGNSTFNGGGAIDNNGSLTITNSTIARNHQDGLDSGVGGILNGISGHITLNNTIVAGNTSLSEPSDLYNSAGISLPGLLVGDPSSVSGSHNLIGTPASTTALQNEVNGNIVGDGHGGTLDVNTILDTTLRYNGGPTKTLALVPGSLAINHGDKALAAGEDGIPLAFDQRRNGFARVVGGAVDIGAFEAQQSFQVAVNYYNGSVTDGQPTTLPGSVQATFIYKGVGSSSGVYGLDDVVSGSIAFGDAIWTQLNSFSMTVDASGTVTDLTYQFAPIDTPSVAGESIANFPLTISGTDRATGHPFTYTYTQAKHTVSELTETPPVADSQQVTTNEDAPVTITLGGSDADGDPLTATITKLPSSGTLYQMNGDPITAAGTAVTDAQRRVIFVPAPGDNGTPDATFGFTVNDGQEDSTQAAVSVNVLNLVDLSGRVFDDRNNDGQFNGNDEGLTGVTVQVWDQAHTTMYAQATTDADGNYFLNADLGAGTYQIVRATDPADLGLLDGQRPPAPSAAAWTTTRTATSSETLSSANRVPPRTARTTSSP